MAIKVNGKLVAGAGKSAYESARDGGYTGTEDEFNTSLANSVTEDGENDVSASKIAYDNTESGMTATNVQNAITELSTALKSGPGVPAGSVFWLAAQTAPEGYLICNGSAISRTEYAALFAVIGTTFGAGDGSTTFALPNLQAAFIRGAGSQNGYSAAFGQKQEATQIANRDQYMSNIIASNVDKFSKISLMNTASQNATTTADASYCSVRPYNIALTPVIKF